MRHLARPRQCKVQGARQQHPVHRSLHDPDVSDQHRKYGGVQRRAFVVDHGVDGHICDLARVRHIEESQKRTTASRALVSWTCRSPNQLHRSDLLVLGLFLVVLAKRIPRHRDELQLGQCPIRWTYGPCGSAVCSTRQTRVFRSGSAGGRPGN